MLNYPAAHTFLQLVRLWRARRRIVRRCAVDRDVQQQQQQPEPPSDEDGFPDIEVVIEPERDEAAHGSPPMGRPVRQAAKDAMERVLAINAYIRATQRSLRSPEPSTSAAAAEEDDTASSHSDDVRYVVERILDERILNGKKELLIQWAGFDEPNWEPAENADQCPEVLAEFNDEVDPGFRFPNGVKPKRRHSDGRPSRELCAFFVRRSVKGAEVAELFGKFGAISDVLVFGEQNEAYIVFESAAEAKAAKRALDLTTHYDGVPHDIVLKKAINDFTNCKGGELVMVNQPFDKLRVDFRQVPDEFRTYVTAPSKAAKKSAQAAAPITQFFGKK